MVRSPVCSVREAGMAVEVTRRDLSAAELRRQAARSQDADAARRMLAIALVLDGHSRADAAATCGMDRQTLRDWVHRYNAEGLAGLSNRRAPGPTPRLSDGQEAELARWVEEGPELARDGVVRWRCRDLRARIEVCSAEGAGLGQRGPLPRVGARRGSRPRAPRDRRYTSAWLFGAVCPERRTGAAVVMPEVNTEAMEAHLAEIGRRVSPGAHAVLVLDGAGWHSSARLRVPDNVSLLPLPRYAPALNPVENVWEYLRQNWLSHRVWDSYDAIVEACCNAWNMLMRMPEHIASI